MIEFFADHNPFDIHAVLINLNNGEVAHESVNVFHAQTIGQSLTQVMAGASTFDCQFRKKDLVI